MKDILEVIVAFIIGMLMYMAAFPCDANAQSQTFYCSNLGQIAERMIRDMTTTEVQPKHYATEQERDLAVQAIHCAERGENVKACVARKCMEETK